MESISLLSIIQISIALIAILCLVVGNAIVMVYVERRGAGFLQHRPGPYEVGPKGILQPIVDSIKLLGKQFVWPGKTDKLLYIAAPVVMFSPVLLMFLTIPFAPWLIGWESELSLILILAFAGLGVMAIILAGWAPNNKYTLLGAARGVAQSVAYEIPLILAILAVVFQTGTFNMSKIVTAQGAWPWQWFFLYQPLAFFIFVVSVFGETNRAPFDLPEGESELAGGFHTEYSGMGFAMFFLAEYANMLLASFLCAVIFLGGWKAPFWAGPWWLIIKAYGFMFFMVWVRWTFPRVRFDQLLNLNWKWLIPLGILNLWLTAVVMKIF